MEKRKPTDFQPGEEVIAIDVAGSFPELSYGQYYHVGDDTPYWDQYGISLREFGGGFAFESHRFRRPNIEKPLADVKKKILRLNDGVTIVWMAREMSLRSTELIMKLFSMGVTNVHINAPLELTTAAQLAKEFGWKVESEIEEPMADVKFYPKILRLNDGVTIADMAKKMSITVRELLMKALQVGSTTVNINTPIRLTTAAKLAEEFGWDVEIDGGTVPKTPPVETIYDNPPFQIDNETWKSMLSEQKKNPPAEPGFIDYDAWKEFGTKKPPIDIKTFVEAGRASGDSLSVQASAEDLDSFVNRSEHERVQEAPPRMQELFSSRTHLKDEVEYLVIPDDGLRVKEACGFKKESHATDYATHQDSTCIIYKSIMKVVPAKITKIE